jgi:ATP-dependent RNA helicase RhlE
MNKTRNTTRNFSRKNRYAKNYKPQSGRSFGGRKNAHASRIDVNRFIKKTNTSEIKKIEIKHTFDEFRLSNEIKFNLKKRNYHTPTPIQDQSIKQILEGKDFIGLANTGTGKTAAFLLPMIDKVYKDKNQKVLIVAPTRELALQIETELHQFSYGMKIFYTTCIGGAPIGKQLASLRKNPSFVIGTPGRLKDLEQRGALNLSNFNSVILDEVDRMLDMGFVVEIQAMLAKLPTNRQSLFFSATMPPKIKDLIGRFMKDPITVSIGTGETATNVDQDILRVIGRDTKFYRLQEVLNEPGMAKVLIFAETKKEVEKLAKNLIEKGFRAESIHGDKRQGSKTTGLNSI